MKIKLTKIEPNPDGKYKDSRPVGDEHIGEFVADPVVGKSFFVGAMYRTSPVVEVLPDNKFRTYNSVYLYQFI